MPRRVLNPLCRPFLKWAGGKRQLLPVLLSHAPDRFRTYYEPFLGGGAMLLALQPSHAIVNDSNAELINCYLMVRDSLNDLMQLLRVHESNNSEEYYYAVRDWDRTADYAQRSSVERAARILYLNKTCFNGLFRVNSQGQFNVPYGKYTKPNIIDEGVLRAVNLYLSKADVQFRVGDFAQAVCDAKRGDFIYFDPPYDPVSDTASFTGYDVNGFSKSEQQRLHALMQALTASGCRVMLSNAYTPFIVDLYRDFEPRVDTLGASRAINSVGHKRGKVDEILVWNYDRQQSRQRRS